jgi:hypothetical protein
MLANRPHTVSLGLAKPSCTGYVTQVATYERVRRHPSLAGAEGPAPTKGENISKPPFLRGVWGDLDAKTL